MSKYYKSFQGLRGYAILLIFLSHCTLSINGSGMNISTKWGACGVEIFIMLSGFLLMSHYKDRNINYPNYVKEKLKKVYPLHLITLACAIPFSLKPLLSLDLKTWLSLACNILLVQSFVPKSSVYFSFNAVSWYLSLNLFFILVGPLCVKYLKRRGYKFSICALFSIFFIEIILCTLCFLNSYAHWILYICPFVRMLDFISGGVIYLILDGWQIDNKTSKTILSLFGINSAFIVCFISMFTYRENWVFSSIVWFIPTVMIIAGICLNDNSLINRILFKK